MEQKIEKMYDIRCGTTVSRTSHQANTVSTITNHLCAIVHPLKQLTTVYIIFILYNAVPSSPTILDNSAARNPEQLYILKHVCQVQIFSSADVQYD